MHEFPSTASFQHFKGITNCGELPASEIGELKADVPVRTQVLNLSETSCNSPHRETRRGLHSTTGRVGRC